MAFDKDDSKGLDLNILQIPDDFDPMEILHTQKGQVNTPDDDNQDDNADDQDDDQQDTGSKDRKVIKGQNRQKPNVIDISDDMLEQGLRKARGEKIDKGADDDNDDNSDDNQSDDNADKKGKGKKQEVIAGAFKVHYDLMVEAGEWEEVEGFDGTQESYLKAREFNENKKIEEGIDAWLDDAFERNPQGKVVGKRLLQHLAAGGTVQDFATLNAGSEIDFKQLDSEDTDVAESVARDVVSSYYASVGWKKPKIEAKIAALSKTGALIDEAKELEEPFNELTESRRQQHQQALDKQKQANQAAQKQVNEGLRAIIQKGQPVGGLPIGATRKELNEFSEFLFGDGQGPSEFQQQLQAGYRDPQFLAWVAAGLKSGAYKQSADGKPDPDTKALSTVEQRLQKALLNKKISDKDSSNDGATRKGGAGKPEFDLDNAVVIMQ